MDDVVMPWAFGGTRSLTHSLTHSILINLFIKVRLNTLLLPPLLSITFVPSAFYAYVWHILEGTSKGYIFSRHKRVASRRWVLYKWKYSKEHWQYHRQEMDLEVLKGRWNNWAGITVVYVVVNFSSQVIFLLLLFLAMSMYVDGVETKEK